MKIAVIITGQLRTFKLCGNVLKNTLLDKYDADVFLTINKCNDFQNDSLNNLNDSNDDDIQYAIKLYNPKNVFVCNGYDSIYEKITANKTLKENKLILQQYYLVQQGYKLLINYINENNVYYDAVVRIRFDQFIFSESSNMLLKYVVLNSRGSRVVKYTPENIDEINAMSKNLTLTMDKPVHNEIYVYGAGQINAMYLWVNDQFWVHSMDTIIAMHDFYNHIPSIIDEVLSQNLTPNCCPYFELIFGMYLIRNNMIIKKSCIIGEFCREIFV